MTRSIALIALIASTFTAPMAMAYYHDNLDGFEYCPDPDFEECIYIEFLDE